MYQIKPLIKGFSSITGLFLLLLAWGAGYAAPVAGVSATDADSLQVDVNGNGQVNKGDTIRHTITIQSTGSDATGMNFSETIDANTTLVGGSISVSPVAVNDTFPVTVLGNVSINSAALIIPFSVTSNDYFGLNPTATITAYDATSTQGGQVVMTTSGTDIGKFTYNPPPGYEGSDTFTYTLSNAVGSSIGTVTITVSGMIWFVNNNAATCTTLAAGCGRLSNPFSTLAAFNAVNDGLGNHPAILDNIFIYESAMPYTGGVTLFTGQILIGQDSVQSIQAITGLTAPTGSALLPVMNTGGNATTITNAGGDGVTLNISNTLNGFTVGNASGSAISGSSFFGTLNVSNVIINNTTGQALNLNGGMAFTTFNSITSSGGTNNISLTSVNGLMNLGSGALSGAAGAAFLVSGGDMTLDYGGSITKTSAGRLVDIQSFSAGGFGTGITLSGALTCNTSCTGIFMNGNTGGSTTFSGTNKTLITGTNAAVNLTNNTGHPIWFPNGGLAITTTSGGGFSATNGGTVTVQGAGNIISSGTGTALNVQNTTIGTGGLTFQSISANGGANGIVLVNTGSSNGLTVTGDGSNTSVGGNGSGGTIQNMSGADGTTAGIGVYLNNTMNVFLRRITIAGSNANYGIRGFSVQNFDLAYATVNGTNGTSPSSDTYGEGSVYFGNATTTGLTGAATITSCNISGGRARNLSVVNTSGTLNRLMITNSTFGLNQNAIDANQSVAVEARTGSNPVMNVTVTGSTFTGAPSDLANFTGQVNTTMDVIFQNNTLSNSHAWNVIGGGGLTLATGGVMTLNASNNTLREADGSAITLQLAAPLGSETTSMDGTINSNAIGLSGVSMSGSKSGNGIFLSLADNTTLPKGQVTLAITNNIIHQYFGNAGIYADNTGGNYNVDLTITTNVTGTPGPTVFAGLALTAGAPSPDDIDVCANIIGNNFSQGDPTNTNDIIVGVSGLASSMRLPGFAGTTVVDVQDFVLANNNVPGTVVFAYSDIVPLGFVGGAPCTSPTH